MSVTNSQIYGEKIQMYRDSRCVKTLTATEFMGRVQGCCLYYSFNSPKGLKFFKIGSWGENALCFPVCTEGALERLEEAVGAGGQGRGGSGWGGAGESLQYIPFRIF